MFELEKKETSGERTAPCVDCPLARRGKEALQIPKPTDEASAHLIKKAFIQAMEGHDGPCMVALNSDIESCLDGSDTTIPAELEDGSIYARADALLEPLIEAAANEALNAPDDKEAFAREKLLIYLAVLNRREGEVAGARHRGELTELARLMETGYLEFRVKDTGPDDVVIEVFNRALFRYTAELTFRKIPFQPDYVLGRYRSL